MKLEGGEEVPRPWWRCSTHAKEVDRAVTIVVEWSAEGEASTARVTTDSPPWTMPNQTSLGHLVEKASG